MPSRQALYIYARSVAYSWQNMSLEDQCHFLKDMYDKTLIERPVNWTLNVGHGTNWDALMNKRWLRKDGRPGGTNVTFEGTSWCGIFATYCLRAIGVPATWTLAEGITAPKELLEKRAGYFASDDIMPGDICVVQENQHHFVVYDRVDQTLFSSDGNLPGQTVGFRDYKIPALLKGVRDQMAYDQSDEGKKNPAKSKYSFYYYRLK